MRALLFSVLVGLALTLVSGRGEARVRLHALVIGSNSPPPQRGDEGEPLLTPLRYADDDAAAVSSFVAGIADSVQLLTVMDSATQALYPQLVAAARPPTLAAVETAVASLSREIEKDRARGEQSVVWLFFSGHGTVSYLGEPGLLLLDGAMSRGFLYDRVLAQLPASYVHLLIDACHAESVVRPRDSQAEVVGVTPADANAVLVRSTLARFPNVGAVLASSSGTQAHEWDTIAQGVFTHELLSALRGAADVNRDRLLEYSEVYAFLSAANRSVSDARARFAIVARAPDQNRRAPLLNLADFPAAEVAWLTSLSGRHGLLQIVDEAGRRLATLHDAPDFSSSLLLPAGGLLYVRSDNLEAQFVAQAGRATHFSELRFLPVPSTPRGGISNALQRGLFRTPYGRGYYAGFTANTPDFVPVPLPPDETSAPEPAVAGPTAKPKESHPRLALGLGLSGSVADVLGVSYGGRLGFATGSSNGPSVSLELAGTRDADLSEWRSMGKFGWLWFARTGKVEFYGGARVGAGVIVQRVDGEAALVSPVAGAGPAVGVASHIAGAFGFFGEIEASAELMREDGVTTISVVPAGWLGTTFGL